jgi:hypothetical protein
MSSMHSRGKGGHFTVSKRSWCHCSHHCCHCLWQSRNPWCQWRDKGWRSSTISFQRIWLRWKRFDKLCLWNSTFWQPSEFENDILTSLDSRMKETHFEFCSDQEKTSDGLDGRSKKEGRQTDKQTVVIVHITDDRRINNERRYNPDTQSLMTIEFWEKPINDDTRKSFKWNGIS